MSEPADPSDNLPPGVTVGWDGRLRGPRGALYDPKEAQAQYVATRAAKRRLKRAMELNGRTPEQLREEAAQARLDNIVPVVDPRFAAPIPIGTGHQGIHPLNPSLRIPIRLTEVGNMAVKNTPLDDLYNNLARYINDPLGFVLWAFPWGEPGTSMEEMTGPEPWQREQLTRIGQRLTEGGTEGAVIEEDTSAGHGVGKSALVSWLILWAISTHADTRGVVTANTDTQLRTKTWAELGKWYQLFIARQLFTLTATAIYIAGDKEREKTWRIDQIPWSKERSEAFAGLHNQGKRLLVIFDEASAIDDVIWEVTEGALTDAKTQIIWCRYGNPTKTSGAFFKKCLAAGTPVLTRGGWKPIEAITPTDEVWDGVEWVEQGGAVKSGHLFTTAVFGVRMTPDHKVLTQEGWVDGQACEGLERAPVRLPDGYDVRWPAQTGRAVESGVRLRRDEADARQRYQEGCRPRARGVMRVRSEGPPTVARDVSPPALCGASRYGATVYAALAQSVEGLWRAWYSCLREVGGLQGLRCGYGGLVLAGVDAGPTRQRRGLRARQLPLGNPAGAAQQYPSEHFHRDPEGRDDVGAGSPGLRNPIQPHVGAAGGGLVPPTGVGDFRDVYDLINCGPRSRFVVAGDDGRALIVHNCTQPRRNTYTRVDSREVSFSNKKQIQAWVDEYGDDSDFVRVRVKGQFPRAGYANFISPELVTQARRRRLEAVMYQTHPKVLAVDPARFGDDFSVITLRQGLKVHWQVALSGFDGPDLASRIFEIVRKGGQMLKGDGVPPGNISCIVYDAIGNGADLDSALRRMRGLPPCIPVQWGQPAKDDKQYFNQRSECWGKMRDFLEHGQIPDDDDLANQLTSLDYGYDARFRIQLQSKKDLKKNGGKSPDKADSTALSFVPELIDRKVTLAKVRPVVRRSVVWTR